MKTERECCNCGAVLGGYVFRAWDKQFYCTSACEQEAYLDDDDDATPEEPEEDRGRHGQYDTLAERDIDRLDCPSSQFD